MRILILGGSSEASTLAGRLANEPGINAVLSLAGRTRTPVTPPIPYRIGGFGGISGLCDYLRAQSVDLVIDATHPFAEQMSAHAEAACSQMSVPLAIFTRPPWTPIDGDRWTEVEDAAMAARAIGLERRRVFLTVGRLQLAAFETAPQHDYLIRSIEPPDSLALPRHRIILARGPFSLESEMALLTQYRIEILVTKNSGGAATKAKLDAARSRGIAVILIRRPPAPERPTFHDVETVLAFIESARHPTIP